MYASTFTLFFVASLGSMVLAVKVPGDPCVYNGGYQWDCTEDTRSILSCYPDTNTWQIQTTCRAPARCPPGNGGGFCVIMPEDIPKPPGNSFWA
ncbi:hypothetical protein MN608_11710 [Microdochium nivale]|nr:hypothetical protein MN608_11710 [Microdochium nivale]